MISGEEVIELLPALAAREPTSGYLFYDCQTDDVRLVLTVLGEAERFGAVCANRLEALSLLERDGRACGVRVLDRESGARVRRPRRERRQRDGGLGRPAERRVRAGRAGSVDPPEPRHPRDPAPRGSAAERRRDRPGRGEDARSSRCPGSGARSSAPPTATTRASSTTCVPPRMTSTICLRAVNEFFGCALTARDLAGAYAGVRPLISSGDPKKSVDISRKAELYEAASGMLTITGGKLTTFRRMAKLTVDRLVAARLPRRALPYPRDPARAGDRGGGAPACAGRARGVLCGAGRPLRLRRARGAGARWPKREGMLAQRRASPGFGDRGELAQPIVPGLPDLLAEVALAARREQALSVGDVLLRRTRLGLLAARELAVSSSSPACWRRSSAGTARACGARSRASRRRPTPRASVWMTRTSGWGTPAGSAVGVRDDGDRRSRAPPLVLTARGAHACELGERPWLMGVVNASPDSFSDDGSARTLDRQVRLAHELVDAGARHPRRRRGVRPHRRFARPRRGRARARGPTDRTDRRRAGGHGDRLGGHLQAGGRARRDRRRRADRQRRLAVCATRSSRASAPRPGRGSC